MSRKKKNKKLFFYNCTLTEERFKTTQEAPNPDELVSIKAYYEMNPEMEGTLVFFPAKLRHAVYPFYNCDEDRISISGNIVLNTAKLL